MCDGRSNKQPSGSFISLFLPKKFKRMIRVLFTYSLMCVQQERLVGEPFQGFVHIFHRTWMHIAIIL